MKKKLSPSIRLIFYFIFSFVSKISFSQQSFNKGLQQQINISITKHHVKDSLVFPGVSTGNGIKASYVVSKTGSKRETELGIAYEQTKYNSYGSGTLSQHTVSIELSDGFNILAKRTNPFAAYIGYSLKASPSYISGYGELKNYYEWNSSLLLSLYQSYKYSWNRQSIFFDIKIPVAGAVYRPQQAGDKTDKNFSTIINSVYSNPLFSSVHNYYAIDISLKYQRQLSNHFIISGEYNFNYIKRNGENNFSDRINGFGLSLIYRSLQRFQ